MLSHLLGLSGALWASSSFLNSSQYILIFHIKSLISATHLAQQENFLGPEKNTEKHILLY